MTRIPANWIFSYFKIFKHINNTGSKKHFTNQHHFANMTSLPSALAQGFEFAIAQLHSFAITCSLRNSWVTCSDDGGREQERTVLLDNGGRGGQRGWSSPIYVFCGVKRKRNEVNIQKKPKGQEENKRKCERRSTSWRVFTSQVKVMFTFMLDSTVVLLELELSYLWRLFHMTHLHAQCTHTHWHGTAQVIMRMHTPSYIWNDSK